MKTKAKARKDRVSLRATKDQKRATPEQIELLKRFQQAFKKLRKQGIYERIVKEKSAKDIAEHGLPKDHVLCRTGLLNLSESLVCFLWLSAIRPNGFRMSPSPDIDLAWHNFILSTREYRAFSEATGYFIDHVPTVSSNRAKIERKRQWMRYREEVEEFVGKHYVNTSFWPGRPWQSDRAKQLACHNCSDCGGDAIG